MFSHLLAGDGGTRGEGRASEGRGRRRWIYDYLAKAFLWREDGPPSHVADKVNSDQ